MTFIIDPMWFYWLNVIDTVKTVNTIVFVFSTIFLVVGICISLENYQYGIEDCDYKAGKKITKIMLPISIISFLIFAFLPSKDTLIEMQIARYATVENAELTVDAIKDAVDYILNAIKEMRG